MERRPNPRNLQATRIDWRPRQWLLPALLAVAILACYGQTLQHQFVNYDDHRYITMNPRVQAGLSWSNVGWAFTTFEVANWHPLTWLSHMLDCQLYGVQHPGWHHFTNVIIHILNAVLLLHVLHLMTGSLWRSAMVAALFALHPLHVEAVAWVSERKELLSTFFGLLTMWSYCLYVRRPSLKQYLATALLFACSLMCKPMLVTLPLVFLPLDYWPLRRWSDKATATRLLLEKLPLLALSAASSVLIVLAQSQGSAMESLENLPLNARIANALVSYAIYLRQTFWPAGLGPLYPLRADLPSGAVIGAAALLLAITMGALALRRTRPWLIVGWLWFLGTLVPVIGLVQVGSQAHADRYTYFPLIGIFIMAVWSVPSLSAKSRPAAHALGALAMLILLCLSAITYHQIGFWKNSVVLSQRAIAVANDSGIAHFNLANALIEEGDVPGAIQEFKIAATFMPNWADIHFNLANALLRQDQVQEAIDEYGVALQLKPKFTKALSNLGIAHAQRGELEAAERCLREALKNAPDDANAHLNLANVLAGTDRLKEAIAHYEQTIELAPDLADAHFFLGNALARSNRLDEAIAQFIRALKLDPSNIRAHMSLATALTDRGGLDAAMAHLSAAAELASRSGQAELHGEVLQRMRELQSQMPQRTP